MTHEENRFNERVLGGLSATDRETMIRTLTAIKRVLSTQIAAGGLAMRTDRGRGRDGGSRVRSPGRLGCRLALDSYACIPYASAETFAGECIFAADLQGVRVRGLTDKVAIVTGGGSGIGRAIALRLAEEGMSVAILDLNAKSAAETAESIRSAGGRAQVEACDICDPAAVARAVAAVEDQVGPIHTLVNNAGWDTPMPFLKTTPEFWQKVVAINYMGPLHVTHAIVSRMVKRNAGRVIFIASDAGRVGSSGEVVYSGCKGATIAFAKALAREVARNNVLSQLHLPGPDQHTRDGLVRRQRRAGSENS